MKTTEYTREVHGFTGSLYIPDHPAGAAVIVITGGAKGLLPPSEIAQRFCELGYTALSLPLFGAAGLPEGPDRLPLDLLEPALKMLREKKWVRSVHLYGMSIGAVYALQAAAMMTGIDGVIAVSGYHIIPEGSPDRKTGSGRSLLSYKDIDLPFADIPYTFEMKDRLEGIGTGDALPEQAGIHPECASCRLLILSSDADETWPSAEAARYFEKRLKAAEYEPSYKVIIYKNASHILGILPEEDASARMKRFGRIMYTSMLSHPNDCLKAIKNSQEEILSFLKNRPSRS